jgi:hypothetical protein
MMPFLSIRLEGGDAESLLSAANAVGRSAAHAIAPAPAFKKYLRFMEAFSFSEADCVIRKSAF